MTIEIFLVSTGEIYADICPWIMQPCQGELGHHGLKTVLLNLKGLFQHLKRLFQHPKKLQQRFTMTIEISLVSAGEIYADICPWKMQPCQGELGHHGLKTVLMNLKRHQN